MLFRTTGGAGSRSVIGSRRSPTTRLRETKIYRTDDLNGGLERDAAISGNTISGNGYAFAGSIAISQSYSSNNTISGNTHGTDLVVTGGAITANTTWANLGGNRTIQVTAAVTVQEGATLTIGSGWWCM